MISILAANLTGSTTLTLNAGGAIDQTAAVVSAGTLTGSAGTTATIDQANTIASLGAFTTGGAFTLNDTGGGLNVNGVVNTNGNPLSTTTSRTLLSAAPP